MAQAPSTPVLDKRKDYGYTKLVDFDSVRILVLDPCFSTEGAEESLTCSIAILPGSALDDDKHRGNGYEALSWCWPKPHGEMKPLAIDETDSHKKMDIPVELYEALLSLRYSDGRKRRLWIDYICIDQNNIEERNHQVARMSEIYGHAENVCIWLGTERDSSEQAFEFIGTLTEGNRDFEDYLNSENLKQFKALFILMKREWFLRRWVVQEVALAIKASIHCGNSNIQWEPFAATVSLLNDDESVTEKLRELARSDSDLKHESGFFDDIHALGASRLVATTTRLKKIAGGRPQKSITLTDLVSSLAMFKTSEPRDTIYALLALAKDSQPSNMRRLPQRLGDKDLSDAQQKALKSISQKLSLSYLQRYPVEYKQSVIAVYQQFMHFSIRTADGVRALDVICRPFAQAFTKGDDVNYDQKLLQDLGAQAGEPMDLPSWIPSSGRNPFRPDTAGSKDKDQDYNINRRFGDPFVSMPDQVSYSAAGSKFCDRTRIRFRKRKNHYSMFVEGFILDAVTLAQDYSQLGNIPAEWLERLGAWAVKDPDVIWRTLVANRHQKSNAPYFFKMLLERITAMTDSGDGVDTATVRRLTGSFSKRRVLSQVQATIRGRSLIETNKYIGLGPREAEPEDLICIIYGCTVPVVLRRYVKKDIEIEGELQEDLQHMQVRLQEMMTKEKHRAVQKLKQALERARDRIAQRRLPEHTNGYLKPTLQEAASSELTSEETQQTKSPPRQPESWRLPYMVCAVLVCTITARYLMNNSILSSFVLWLAIPRTLAGMANIITKTVTLPMNKHSLGDHVSMSGAIFMLVFCIGMVIHSTENKALVHSLVLALIFVWGHPVLLPSASFPLRLDTVFRKAQHKRHDNVQSAPEAVRAPPNKYNQQVDTILQRMHDTKEKDEQDMRKYHYKVIGECYIDGMMNGEAIDLQFQRKDDASLRSRILELR